MSWFLVALGTFIVPKAGRGEAPTARAALLTLTAISMAQPCFRSFFPIPDQVCTEHLIYTGPGTNDSLQRHREFILWNQIGLLYLKNLKSKPHLNWL